MDEKIDFAKVSWGCEGRKWELVSLFKDQNFLFPLEALLNFLDGDLCLHGTQWADQVSSA